MIYLHDVVVPLLTLTILLMFYHELAYFICEVQSREYYEKLLLAILIHLVPLFRASLQESLSDLILKPTRKLSITIHHLYPQIPPDRALSSRTFSAIYLIIGRKINIIG